jgi:V/A-type H+-transporting ATPase subunit C
MSALQSLIGQHFAYASGRTGVLQQLLLTASDRDRLLGSADLKEAEAILTELKLTSPIDQGLKKSDEILLAIGAWVRAEVETMAPESKKTAFHILWLEEDAPILSYLLKKHHGLTSAVSTEPQSGMTAYGTQALQALVEEDTVASLPSHLIEFVKNAKGMKNASPQSIDSAVAQYIATVQIALARASGSAALKDYIEHKIDLSNIRTMLRVKSNELLITYHASLLNGGTLNLGTTLGDPIEIAKAIDRSSLPYSLGEAIRKNADDPNALEHALSQVIAGDIAHMWNIPLSIEPVFAFAALALSQMRLLRVLLIGKRAHMSPQEIKLMLPPFLSASHYVL